jgi:DNA-binding NarL/FixJ family response regulator
MAGTCQVRILVVDDFAAWRDQIRLLLEKRPEWKVIGEASDGDQAIESAVDMRPDIILLDVGMPVLNGIEAAKIIRKRCPQSRILFVTQDDDPDLRSAGMQMGAAGYLLKANAEKELFPAISSALAR